MNPARVRREDVKQLTDLPNVGPKIASALVGIGIHDPGDLQGADPRVLYQALCTARGERQDPCVLDVFIAITRFADGGPPEPWWAFTAERRRRYRDL